MKAKIKRWGINGEGIAYAHKKAVFIDHAIPGEVVEFEIDEDRPNYTHAHVTNVLEPSPRRREHPVCGKWESCGGCSLMHVDYKGQVRMKEEVLKEALRKYADYTGPVEPLIKNPEPLGYRNACKLPFGMKDGKICTGMYKKGTNDFVPVERCMIHSKKLEKVRTELMEIFAGWELPVAKSAAMPGLLSLVLKEFDQQVHVTFVTGEMEIPQELIDQILALDDVVSVWQSVKEPDTAEYELFGKTVTHLGGQDKMTLQLADYELALLPKSFFQLNSKQAIALYQAIASWIPEHSHLLVEAYSGVGAISLFVADHADQVIGIEYISDAVDNANTNARLNHKDNVSFICGDAGEEMEKIIAKQSIDTLIVDPPRSGLNQLMKQAILESLPKSMIYVSCNPATLGKDLNVLQKAYEIRRVQPFDFFSQTPHVETAVLLVKKAEGRSGNEKDEYRNKKDRSFKTDRVKRPNGFDKSNDRRRGHKPQGNKSYREKTSTRSAQRLIFENTE